MGTTKRVEPLVRLTALEEKFLKLKQSYQIGGVTGNLLRKETVFSTKPREKSSSRHTDLYEDFKGLDGSECS